MRDCYNLKLQRAKTGSTRGKRVNLRGFVLALREREQGCQSIWHISVNNLPHNSEKSVKKSITTADLGKTRVAMLCI